MTLRTALELLFGIIAFVETLWLVGLLTERRHRQQRDAHDEKMRAQWGVSPEDTVRRGAE